MQKVVLTFGLIGGVILTVTMLVAFQFHEQIGFDRGVYVGYTSMVLAFLMVYFGVQSYRDNVAGGSITFGRAFNVGLLISLVIMACYVVVWEVTYYNFMPDYLDQYTDLRARAGAPVRRLRRGNCGPGRGDARVRRNVQEQHPDQHRVHAARAVAGRARLHAADGGDRQPEAGGAKQRRGGRALTSVTVLGCVPL